MIDCIGAEEVESGGVTGKIIARFKQLIAQGKLTPGSKLPSERDLAKRFGVNRATLRQVLKILEIMGVVSQHVGDGTYLNHGSQILLDEPLDFLMLMEDTSHHELFEMRLLVEPEIAARAAERATSDDLARLRRAIDAMENSHNKQERLQADLEFHEAIFDAAGNRVFHLIFRVIHRANLRSMAHLAERVELSRPLAFHKAIYKAIFNRQPVEARQQMIDHLIDARSLLASAAKRHEATIHTDEMWEIKNRPSSAQRLAKSLKPLRQAVAYIDDSLH